MSDEPRHGLPLAEIAGQMLLDRLAVRASRALTDAGVPHVLLKGVTTARWLYDPPRPYRDVDMLVRPSALRAAVERLHDAGIAAPTGGRLGEEASHSQVLVAPDGRELDLHVTLPTLPTPGGARQDDVWTALEPHITPFPLEDTQVPALDPAGRLVVFAMHYVASGRESEQVREDFRRARRALTAEQWAAALRLAETVGVAGQLASVVAIEDGADWLDSADPEVRLRLTGGDPAAIRLQAVLQLPRGRRVAAMVAEVLPSPAMLLRQHPDAARRDLPLLYTRRWLWGLRVLPTAVSQVRRSRRSDAGRSGRLLP